MRALAFEAFHAQCGFKVVQTHFQSPASQVGLGDLLSRVELGVQQCGDQHELSGAKSLLADSDANDSHDDFLWELIPLFLRKIGRLLFGFAPGDQPVVFDQRFAFTEVDLASGSANEIGTPLFDCGGHDVVSSRPVIDDDVIGGDVRLKRAKQAHLVLAIVALDALEHCAAAQAKEHR